jgi:hypothetical protein
MALTPLDRLLEYKMHLLRNSGHPRQHAPWWHDLVMALAAAWLTTGMVLDTFAHSRNSGPESFFTPWHLVLYTGYVAAAAWIVYLLVNAHRTEGRTGSAAVPHGYGPAVIALPAFLVFGLFDMLWHLVFGVETSLDALFSPSHLGLASAGLLIVAAPWLSLWRRRVLGADDTAPPWPLAFLPGALSLGFALVPTLMFTQYVNAFRLTPQQIVTGLRPPYGPPGWVVAGSVAFTTILVLAVVLLVTRRFRPPFGFFSVVFIGPALISGAFSAYEYPAFVLLYLAAGVLVDFLTWLVRPELRRRRDLIVFAAAWPLLTWSAYLIIGTAYAGMGPVVEIATGMPVLAALIGTVYVLVYQPESGGVAEAAPPNDSGIPAQPSPFDEVMARAKAMAESRRNGE